MSPVKKKKEKAEKRETPSEESAEKKEMKILEDQVEGKDKFIPKIVVFACNWCSYAGADTAGINKIQYSPRFRIIRVMCSGRINPSFVLRAFERGADGVIVSGCHFGDCHYVDGNEKAVEKFEITKNLCKLLGLEEKRIRLEWISAAEGVKFGQVIDEFVGDITALGRSPFFREETGDKTKPESPVPDKKEKADKCATDLIEKRLFEEILHKSGAFLCLDCGKCTATCPLSRYDRSYSPRRILFNALQNRNLEMVLNDPRLWSCFSCMACDEICLAGVNFSSLIKELRRLAFEDGRVGFESHGGLLHLIMKLMAHSGIRQNRMDWLTKDIKVDDHSEWLFYVGCAPYFNACFTHLKVNTLDAVKSSLKLLNLAGIEPALLENERCCGHDLLWSGDVQGFRALAGLNIQEIKKRGFKKMIFFCPECYYSFKKDYQNIFGNLGLEMKSVLEILNEKGIERFAIDSEPDTVTFQDPCRLSRHLDLYDVPRKLMAKIPAITLNEMMHSGRTSRCCAGSNWMNCNAFFRDVQLSRFEEAQETASRYLLTACPKCDIHLRCAGQNWETSKKKPVKLEDIHNFILSKLVNNK